MEPPVAELCNLLRIRIECGIRIRSLLPRAAPGMCVAVQLDLEDQDQIDCMLEQQGGAREA